MTYHPQDEANFLSKVIFWWIFPLLWKGARNPLNHDDLYPIKEEEKSGQRTDVLEEKWREEMASAQKVAGNISLLHVSGIFSFRTFWSGLPLER